MTSTIKVNTITTESGSTLTIGGCGKTIALASGASQTGFGATGGISWQTSIKTTDFTAVSGEGYFVNTSGGSDITVTLPASPSAGNVVAIKDYARTFGTNKVILARNGSNMDGNAANTNLETDGQSVTLVFMDSTKGWSFINEDTTSSTGQQYIAATGGTVSTVCTNFKVHTFTGPGTFCVSCAGNSGGSNTVDYLVIAGGGGGGLGAGVSDRGAGGGAGGTRFSNGTASGCYSAGPSPLGASALPVTATGFPIVVGAGGADKGAFGNGNDGSVSSFSTISSAGGGGGGTNSTTGNTGGSGGGAGGGTSGSGVAGAAGNTPPVSPPQGGNGGRGGGPASPNIGGGGGGGATGNGGDAKSGGSPGGTGGGDGGAALTSSINGTPTARGGGGAGDKTACATGGGAGGPGACQAGTANTGGGGQGGHPCGGGNGSAGGSGIVIIRYKFQ
jgi:hypothetical protein